VPVIPQINPNIRIPNLPMGAMTDAEGQPTPEEKTFRQTLLTSLQNNFGSEGCVIPSLPTVDILTIQNNSYYDPATAATVRSCAAGTFIYDTTTDQIKVSVLVGGLPTFKVVTVV